MSLKDKLLTRSLLSSNKQRGEDKIRSEIEEIVPDISNQYTNFKIDSNDKYTNINANLFILNNV